MTRIAASSLLFTTLALFLTMAPSSIEGLTPVNLGTAGNYVILAETGITTTGTTSVNGSMAISPTSATGITGFTLALDGGGTFATSALIPSPGKVYASDYGTPTPATLTTAVGHMEAAYLDAEGRTSPNYNNLGSGTLTGPLTLSQGLYSWSTAVSVGGSVTISGSATDVWIFQIPSTLTFDSSSEILLSGGALCSNVFWQVKGAVSFLAGSAPQGIILAKVGVAFGSGATLICGRALAQTAVTLIANDIRQPV